MPERLADRMLQVLGDELLLREIAGNGRRRMGSEGASLRIAEEIWKLLGSSC